MSLAAARAGRLYKLSEGCSPAKITGKATREACEASHKLEGELETGKAAARLDDTAAAIRTRLAKGVAVQTADPGATAVSLIVGTSADNVAAWSALLGSLALELAGMIAMMRAESRPAVESRAKATEPASQVASVIAGPTLMGPPKPAAVAGADTVGRFMLACLRKAPGEEAQGGAIYARYQQWCAEQQLSALNPRTFSQQFAERCERVGIVTRRDGRKVFCVGIKLVA